MSDIATKSKTIDKYFNFLTITGKENSFKVLGNTNIYGNLNVNKLNHTGYTNLVMKNIPPKKNCLVRVTINGKSTIMNTISEDIYSQENVSIEFLG